MDIPFDVHHLRMIEDKITRDLDLKGVLEILFLTEAHSYMDAKYVARGTYEDVNDQIMPVAVEFDCVVLEHKIEDFKILNYTGFRRNEREHR
jgi:hypothetical protein